MTYTQTVKMYRRIQREIQFEEPITPRRFRTTVLTDLYDTTRDIKLAQMSAGHTTAAMTLKHYVKGRNEEKNTALPVATLYGLTIPDSEKTPQTQENQGFAGTKSKKKLTKELTTTFEETAPNAAFQRPLSDSLFSKNHRHYPGKTFD